MAIEVEFISKELIKPSSPTPHHLRNLHFSFLDQMSYPVSMPFVLFYEKSNIPNKERCNLLKQSLSKALTIFYPLAGRINNYSNADCNDEGALFIETKANCQLSEILQNRNQYHNHRHKFIPLQPHQGIHQYGSLFQITYFNCGGLAITFAMPHMLGDALSQFIFLNGWAAVARGDIANLNNIPPMGLSSIFPPKNIYGSDSIGMVFKEKIVTKSFMFDAFTLSALRDEYSANGEKLSRVQALSVFISSRITSTLSRVKGNNKRSAVINPINLRPIMDPPISEQSFGNLVWFAVAVINKGDECHETGRKIKDSIKSVNAETVKKLQSDEQLDLLKETFQEFASGKTDRCTFSSLCNFPVYEIDFGWGKPEWVVSSGMILNLNNVLIIFMDTKEGRGIEAWITMKEEDMAEFENDNKLRAHISKTMNGEKNFNSRL